MEFRRRHLSERCEFAHAFTHAGTYQVRAHAIGLSGSSSDQSKWLTIHGAVFTKYAPGAKRRPEATTP
jgi:hypothetical protein